MVENRRPPDKLKFWRVSGMRADNAGRALRSLTVDEPKVAKFEMADGAPVLRFGVKPMAVKTAVS